MRIRPRRNRPQTGVTLVALGFLLAVLIWAAGELGRLLFQAPRIWLVRGLVGVASGSIFLFFLIGWRYV